MQLARHFAAVFTVTVLALSVWGCAEPEPATPESFLEDVRAALEAQDEEALSLLVNWEGITDEHRGLTEGMVQRLVSAPLLDVELVPLPEQFVGERVANGLRYRPNVEVAGMVKVQQSSEGGSFDTMALYGLTDGQFRFAGTVVESTN